jgi:hypothetical protein
MPTFYHVNFLHFNILECLYRFQDTEKSAGRTCYDDSERKRTSFWNSERRIPEQNGKKRGDNRNYDKEKN